MGDPLPEKKRIVTPVNVPIISPSPVSSSYSELRGTLNSSAPWSNNYAQSNCVNDNNASEYQRLYVCPSSYSQTSSSSVVESLYEPISKNIQKQSNSLQRPRNFGNDSKDSKEAEIDELTDLLMHSLRKVNVPPNEVFFGTCYRCGEQVVGEGTGCSAMGKILHLSCLTCRVCDCSLQGKSFFYQVDGKPYCEKDYMSRLEKCCVCGEAVVDRILRANGRPFHPQCFTCVICFKRLEGIQFTIDATNQIYCIEDFHTKFAPRCSVCERPIMPEPGKEETVRVVALDRSFHVNCYKCEDCGLLLRSEAEGSACYPLDGHVLCKSCNAKRVVAIKIK